MAVPGLKPTLPVKAKVRVGIKVKKVIQGREKEVPQATDYFVFDDPELVALCGSKPKLLYIRFPFADKVDVFSSGLEKWAGSTLLCYTKGDGRAHRISKGVKNPDGTLVIDTGPGAERMEQRCPADQCVYFGKAKNQGCRPMARLDFQVMGGPRDSVYRFDTKSLHSIEAFEGVLSQYADLRGINFALWVETRKSSGHTFPVVSLREVAASSHAAPTGERGSELPGSSSPSPVFDSDPDAEDPDDLLKLLAKLGRTPDDAFRDWTVRVGHDAAVKTLRGMIRKAGV